MTFVRNLGQLGRRDAAIAGAKGASLGEMLRAGVPVPPGYVVTVPTFDRFLDEAGMEGKAEAVLNAMDRHDIRSVESASARLRGMLSDMRVPADIASEVLREFRALRCARVAVRSSATAEDSNSASWAGALETYLGVREKDLSARIEQCWSSLFTPRAIVYRIGRNLHARRISVAVVVQEMVAAEVAGVAFTVHPVTGDRAHMVIEAGLGLGETIASGRITPDLYVVDKKSGRIAQKTISEQREMTVMGGAGTRTTPVPKRRRTAQKLPDTRIRELAAICRRVERLYGRPQDIEWALDRAGLFITQARPITTL